jgi:hypothetical protein
MVFSKFSGLSSAFAEEASDPDCYMSRAAEVKPRERLAFLQRHAFDAGA